MTDKPSGDEDICDALVRLCCVGVRAGGDVLDDNVRRRAEILEKIEACTARIRVTQARIDACQVAGLDASDEEKWMATELDLLGILIEVVKALKGSDGTN